VALRRRRSRRGAGADRGRVYAGLAAASPGRAAAGGRHRGGSLGTGWAEPEPVSLGKGRGVEERLKGTCLEVVRRNREVSGEGVAQVDEHGE
jgi:hypothetical protein